MLFYISACPLKYLSQNNTNPDCNQKKPRTENKLYFLLYIEKLLKGACNQLLKAK
jgi:hypothetical protein